MIAIFDLTGATAPKFDEVTVGCAPLRVTFPTRRYQQA